MNSSFLITGYPRSRTAWLANWMTYGRSFCFHEAVKWAPPCEVPELLASAGTVFAGTSDSLLPFYIDQVWPLLPSPRLVIVERDPKDALASLLTYGEGLDKNMLREVHRKTGAALRRVKSTYPALIVDYADLPLGSACRRIWEYCLPEEPFTDRHSQRWLMLDSMRVQLSLEKEMADLDNGAAETIAKLVRDFAPEPSHTTPGAGRR